MTAKKLNCTAIGIFLAMVGCQGTVDNSGGAGGGGGASSSSGGGGASSSSGGGGASSSSGGGGASSSSGGGGASSSSGGGGASSSSGGGGANAGCPEDLPTALEACDTAERCAYDEYSGRCSTKLPAEASCVEGEWHVLTAVTCEPSPTSLSCDPFGTWLVEPGELAGDYAEELSWYSRPFEVSVSLGDDGLIYVLNHSGRMLSADGCSLHVFTGFPQECWEDQGEVFCDATWRTAIIDFSKVPAEAAINFTREGEGSGTATATGTVTKKM
ncbi:hypothetical protein [Sorangium sp. So ce1078]|uniref:hypothetical protein n=1 Tax=Sorangium sp. So ce1078 TaxID=3133329 RepID=UPI003F619B94